MKSCKILDLGKYKFNNVYYKKQELSFDSVLTGIVSRISDGVAKVENFNGMLGEIVLVNKTVRGIILSIKKTCVFIAVLGNERSVSQGDKVSNTNSLLSFNFSSELLGHILDGLGKQIDLPKAVLLKEKTLRIDCKAPGVATRMSVFEPLHTGIMMIDSMIPIGRGQKELIIGDRQTGKTAVTLSTMVNQHYEAKEVFNIYVSIGQKRSEVHQIARMLKRFGALYRTVLISASASESPALQYLAPYTGCSVGERFRDSGYHSLLIYDDLSKQAVAYRQMSLILRKSPGREAFPGDVFYLHARLLERAAKMSYTFGAGSLTALPIVETQASDVSAYIPTNVISITDGQIFLETELFMKDIKPAINVTLSVSRVGNKAQIKIMNQVVKSLKNEIARYNTIAYFLNFGANLDKETQDLLHKGSRLIELLKQENLRVFSPEIQILLIASGLGGHLNKVSIENIKKYKNYIIAYLNYFQNLFNFSFSGVAFISNTKLLDFILELITFNSTSQNLLNYE